MSPSPFAELIARSGLPQIGLAGRAGVSLRTIERWVSGRHGQAQAWTIARVARVLKIEFEELQAILTAQVRLAARAAAAAPGPGKEG